MLTYFTMFCTMFDLNTMDYFMEHIELTKIMHLSRKPLKRGKILPMFGQKYCSYMPQLISKSATLKYLRTVGENLIFLFSPYICCRSERALSEQARQHTNFVQLLKISILPEPQSMLVKSHFTNMQRAAI